MGRRVEKGNQVHTAPTRPGLIVMDTSLGVVAYNGEALQILTYPEPPEKIRHVDTWLANKIRTDLTGRNSPARFVEEFRSARRMYLCRSFPLDLRAQNGNGSHSNGSAAHPSSGSLQVVMLERRSNEAVKLSEVSERFGLTVRELETVQYLLQGFTSKEIAQRMEISPNTVKAFLRLVMVKMNVSTRSGIIGRIVGPRT
jgi:DNA-binding CsgD family transcriptional regulator